MRFAASDAFPFRHEHTMIKRLSIAAVFVYFTISGCTGEPRPQSAAKEPANPNPLARILPTPERKAVGLGEVPLVYRLSDNDHFYVYADYVVRVGRSTEVDESIEIYKRIPVDDEEMFKLTLTATSWLKIVEHNNYFHGLGGDYVFVDAGTAPEPRTYFIYSLKEQKLHHTISYSSPVSFSSGHLLTYFASTNIEPTKENCPRIDEWKENELGAEIQEETMLDLNTLIQKGTGNRRCVSLQ